MRKADPFPSIAAATIVLTKDATLHMTATMTENPENPAENPAPAPLANGKPAKPAKKEDNFFVFLIKLILVVGSRTVVAGATARGDDCDAAAGATPPTQYQDKHPS